MKKTLPLGATCIVQPDGRPGMIPVYFSCATKLCPFKAQNLFTFKVQVCRSWFGRIAAPPSSSSSTTTPCLTPRVRNIALACRSEQDENDDWCWKSNLNRDKDALQVSYLIVTIITIIQFIVIIKINKTIIKKIITLTERRRQLPLHHHRWQRNFLHLQPPRSPSR